jgi:hypothetical protein
VNPQRDTNAGVPLQLTRDLAGLQQPAGVVHFASSDNASLWGGFIDGAIESAPARGPASRGSTHDMRVGPAGVR